MTVANFYCYYECRLCKFKHEAPGGKVPDSCQQVLASTKESKSGTMEEHVFECKEKCT